MPSLEKQITDVFNQRAKDFPHTIPSDDERIAVLRNILEPIAGRDILDVGCGKGRFAKTLTELGAHVTGIDPSATLLQEAKRSASNMHFIEGSATQLPVPAASFDAVICVEALEHVPDTELALKEMYRVLRTGGTVVVIDKNRLGLSNQFPLPAVLLKRWWEIRNQWMYSSTFPFKEKWFSGAELIANLREAGFSKTGVRYFNVEPRWWHLLPRLSFFAAWYGKKA